jgi:hypothetical protein
MFTNELTRRLQAANQNVIAVSLHPGVISSTGLSQHVGVSAAVGAMSALWARTGAFSHVVSEKGKNIPQGTNENFN